MNSENIIFLPGLAADSRMFHKLKPAFPEAVYIDWIPALKGESLLSYAGRLSREIPKGEYLIAGASFGGIIGLHLAEYLNCRGCVLIGSVSSPRQISWTKKLVLKSGLLQRSFLSSGNKGYRRQLNGKKGEFISWAYSQLGRWKERKLQCPVYHIHGSKDSIFPLKKLKADKVLNGGHNIIHSHPEEITVYIKEVSSKL